MTVQQIALRILRYIGVTQLTPQAPGSELESLGPGDLEDVASAISGALQEIASVGPSEVREAPGYAVLNAPAQVTFNVTAGSPAISAISGWQSWMQGCTVRASGDDQDNEFLGQTRLARAYMGATGSVSATVYGDAITLDSSIAKVFAPLWLPNQLPLHPAQNRTEFMRLGGYPLITDTNGMATGLPFYLYYRKPVNRPWVWFIDAAYDASLGYTQRRIRFSPMPAQAYSVAYTAALNPPRVTAADILAPGFQSGAQLTVTGCGDGSANQAYGWVNAGINDSAIFQGQTNAGYFLYQLSQGGGEYVLSAGYTPFSVPAAYWTAGSATLPTSAVTWAAQGSASGSAAITPSFTGAATADPGTVLPIPNDWVESILLPMALMRFTGAAVFKNSAAVPEITRQYKTALAQLKDSRGLEGLSRARYV